HFFIANMSQERLQKWSGWGMFASLSLLILVLVIGEDRGGAKRWIGIGPVGFQPSDFAKVAIILSMSVGLAIAFKRLEKYRNGEVPKGPKTRVRRRQDERIAMCDWIVPLVCSLAAAGLVTMEPDMDTAAVLATITLGLLFLGGVSSRVVLSLVLCGVVALGVLAKAKPHAIARILAHPLRHEQPYRDGISYQSVQSEAALQRGGLVGRGFTEGSAKNNLPEATSDYVMTTVGEEFGFMGFIVSFLLVAILVGRLWWHAMRHPAAFGKLVLAGTALWIGVQATINITMTNGLLWTMGITMPFYSDGGSSLIALWMGLGLAQAALVTAPQATKEVKDASHRHGWRYGRPHLPRA
ncbi:MAG: FtsW/RodA/SpoVE family cell cycle protein, partial [Fimbriimonadaceae bacterium]|nr:FtsW/RodA/SpoVE family cell cycle protein [Fimbriimonadaceae bacterium]